MKPLNLVSLDRAGPPMPHQVAEPLPVCEVREIGVFRALMLGDLLCATPALRALRRRYPAARLTFIGLPWAREWALRQSSIDDFIAFPGHPDLPEQPYDAQAWAPFMERVLEHRFDLLVQLHGSGVIVNPLLAGWGARQLAGFHLPVRSGPQAPPPAVSCPWPRDGHEIERLLRLVDALGVPRCGTGIDLPLRPSDHVEARALLAARSAALSRGAPYVCVHPGGQWPSRRWPPRRFAVVVDALAARGLVPVITGVASEAPLAQALTAELAPSTRALSVDLVGLTSLWTAGAVIAGSRLLVCNDTGVSHMAAALHVPSVVVACGSEVARWAPLDTRRHRVLWADRPCRPCLTPQCPYAHECAWAVGADAVIQAALELLEPEHGQEPEQGQEPASDPQP